MTSRFTANKSETETTEDTTKKESGAMWKKETKKGDTYFNVKVSIDGKDYWYKAFLNRRKSKDSSPDFSLFKD